jgi:hypothetical protein
MKRTNSTEILSQNKRGKIKDSNKLISYRFTDIHIAAIFDIDDTFAWWTVILPLSDDSSLETRSGRTQPPYTETQNNDSDY